jgi:hypothetical protein
MLPLGAYALPSSAQRCFRNSGCQRKTSTSYEASGADAARSITVRLTPDAMVSGWQDQVCLELLLIVNALIRSLCHDGDRSRYWLAIQADTVPIRAAEQTWP